MGGIIGKLSFEHDEPLARPVLEQMLATLRHRGAAGSGIHVQPGIALGWCGDYHAPITRPVVAATDDRTVHAVADSALTNAAQLRAQLMREGHVVRGRSDADVIVQAYVAWGDACIEHLRGPFACAIWDDSQQRLLLARDALGLRPLFFALLHGHGVVFGSEIRAVLQDPGVGREWCAQAIDAYLALGYVPAPLTAYQRISKLEPAQRLIVVGRRLHVDYYWDLPLPDASHDASATADALPSLLSAAAQRHGGDEPIRATLYSGGVASTTLLATATSQGDAVITVVADDDPAGASRSLSAARELGVEPLVELASPDIAAIASRLAGHFDEPLADPSAISQYATLVSARLYTTRALAGHGASALWAAFAPRRGNRPGSPWRDWLHSRQVNPAPTGPLTDLWNSEYRHALYTRGFAWQVRDADPFARHLELYAARSTDDPLDRAHYVEARTFLPDSVLAVAERTSIAAGLDLHFPFLDRDLVEFSARIPASVRQPGRDRMQPLRQVLAQRLPPALMPPAQRTRAGHSWLPAALTTLVPPVLLGPGFDGRGIVSRPVLRQLWEDHAAGRRDHSHRLWSLLMLEFWFREFIDGDAVEQPLEYAVLRAA